MLADQLQYSKYLQKH